MAAAKVKFGNLVEFERIVGIRYKPECDKIKKLILQPNIKQKCRFQVDGKAKNYDGNPLSIKFEYSTSEMELTTSSWKLGQGEVALTNITTKKTGDFIIKVKVNGIKTNEINITSKELDKDIFSEKEINRLIAENSMAQAFNRSGSVIGNGYCINAADRSIGALLDDKNNFYTEPNLKSQGGNGVRLKSSRTRAGVIKTFGYIKKSITIKTDKFNTNQKPTKFESSLKTKIENDIKGKLGYHVYYYSMHGEYHVMLLLIDNNNPCKVLFSILDQGYVDERDLDFNTIDNKFLELIIKFWKNKKHYSKNILMWKIQRK